eukprot:GHVU01130099.1.p1 GENE.GHVU01130099.1~~GHVU01130099.1.p1  ORF type:complete len:173 (+),score=34.22 GHVU01130099.1:1306-1824(+)
MADLEKASSSIDSLTEESKMLNEEVRKVSDLLNEAKGTSSEEQAQIVELQARLNTMVTREQHCNAIRELQRTVAESEEEIKSLKKDVSFYKEEASQLSERPDAATTEVEISGHQSRIRILETQLAAVRSEYETAANDATIATRTQKAAELEKATIESDAKAAKAEMESILKR